MDTFLQNGLLVIFVEHQKRKGQTCCKLLPGSDILRLRDFVDCCCRFFMLYPGPYVLLHFRVWCLLEGKTGPSSGWGWPPIKYNETLPSV